MAFKKKRFAVLFHVTVKAHMLQGWLQSTPLLFFPHMLPQLWGISLRCHSGFVTLPANQI